MSKRWPGSFITTTIVSPSSVSAPGMWTLQSQQQAIANNNWPVVAIVVPHVYAALSTNLAHSYNGSLTALKG